MAITVSILVVDDSKDSLNLIESILKKAGYSKIIKAESAKEAYEALKIDDPNADRPDVDLILMDNIMPGISGIDACRKIKNTKHIANIPILMVTGDESNATVKKAFEAGAIEYIRKPLREIEFLSRIKSVLDRIKAEERIGSLAMFPSENPHPIFRILIGGIIEYANNAALPIMEAWKCKVGDALPDHIQNIFSEAFKMGDKMIMVEYENIIYELLFSRVPNCDYVNVYGMDITKRKHAEDALHSLLEKLEQKVKDRTGELVKSNINLQQEIKERKMLESQLVQAQKLESIGQLAAGIAHEINTPIQYVGDNLLFISDSFRDIKIILDKYSELLKAWENDKVNKQLIGKVQEAVDDSEIRYLFKEIPKAIQESLEGVEGVSEIVKAMKEFSHPDEKEMISVDINHAIRSTIAVARNEWKYVANVETCYDENLPPVECLPGDFNQAILNIIINAAHSIEDVVGDGSKGKGIISISTSMDGGSVEVRIKDTGNGIPEEVRQKIYDPFYTTKEVGKGTGQGLAIAHSAVVGKHKGTITFDTEIGKGTTFIIRLPIKGRND
jgi:signal transduction histidine kinase/AmiR/NasT family two-component response regulator